MTSRVQKGGTLFRPVVKSRNRTADRPSEPPRQSSIAVESTQNDDSITLSQNVLTQTPSLPESSVQDSQLSSSDTGAFLSTNVPDLPDLSPSIAAPPIPIRPTNTDSNENPPAIMIPSQSRGPPIPITIGSRTPSGHSTQSSTLVGTSAISIPTPTSAGPSQSPFFLPSPSPITIGSTRIQPTPSPMPPPIASTSTSVETPLLDEEPLVDAGNASAGTKRTGSKKRKTPADQDFSGDNADGTPEPSSSRKPRGRRQRKPSPLPFDPDADPGEDIDPTTMTMADLCEDTGQGRVSTKAAEILSNHANWKTRNREKRARMKAMMEAKKYGRDIEDDDSPDAPAEQANPNKDDTAAQASTSALVDESGSGFDYSQNLATSRFNVQVRIGPNGETIIDEESLLVDRQEHDATANYTHIEESDHTKFVNSGTYGKRYRGSRWSAEETELFYDALAQYGENYELIAYVLPGRDRKACKNKFKAEDKKNPARINHCLNNSVPVDMKTLSRMTGKDFSGPVPEIRAPNPPPQIQMPEPTEETDNAPDKVSKKKRGKSRGAVNDDAMIVGNADNFES